MSLFWHPLKCTISTHSACYYLILSFFWCIAMLHTMQDVFHFKWTAMHWPLSKCSCTFGVVRFISFKYSISSYSVKPFVFKYFSSSKIFTFKSLKWYDFPAWIWLIMFSHSTSFMELVLSLMTLSHLYFIFSFCTMGCLFSFFVSTLTFKSTVS